ncbi:MAG: chloramphenicol acetyltransferase [Anaerolineales bacterium]|jgi:chloramphenicol O-acetyltransferase type A
MRKIDMNTWPRRQHFEFFRAFDHPHFSICANLELPAFDIFVRQRSLSLNVSIVYVLARAANAFPEFRYRIRDNQVIEHEVFHPSTTILSTDNLFSFCTIQYAEDFSVFAQRAKEKIAHVQQQFTLADESEADDLLFMTSIPWLSFTSFTHPMHLQPADSVPRFAWGKTFPDGDSLKIPLSVQAHHALMDGLHVAKYFDEVQGYLHHPGTVLGNP